VQDYIRRIDWNWVRNEIPVTTSQNCDPATDPQSVANQWEYCWWSCNRCRWESDVAVCPTKGDWGLTFDDGPVEATPQLLDYLATDGTKATFFVTGTQVLQFPDIVRRIANEGHEIGIHTW
jgi:chitin deacetylase